MATELKERWARRKKWIDSRERRQRGETKPHVDAG